ncbi:hypothetical protein Tco_0627237 [Tanacetum coccineum]|uniref:Uncharacterized protein n=1 Tax=Tanacetum coccineum TaxID=301880 RepID=A0ABQ4WLW9_9ASTR
MKRYGCDMSEGVFLSGSEMLMWQALRALFFCCLSRHTPLLLLLVYFINLSLYLFSISISTTKDAFCDGFNISPVISNSAALGGGCLSANAHQNLEFWNRSRPLFNSLFIHGTGSEKSTGVDDPAETIRNVRVRNTSKCHGIVGSRGLCQSSVVSQGVHESVHQNQLTHTPTLVQASHVDYTSKTCNASADSYVVVMEGKASFIPIQERKHERFEERCHNHFLIAQHKAIARKASVRTPLSSRGNSVISFDTSNEPDVPRLSKSCSIRSVEYYSTDTKGKAQRSLQEQDHPKKTIAVCRRSTRRAQIG